MGINYDDFVYIDVETTGLNLGEHEIIELSYAIGNGPIITLYPEYLADVLQGADPMALEVNRFIERFASEDEQGAWIDVPAEQANVDRVYHSQGQLYQAYLNLPKASTTEEWDAFAKAIDGKTPVGANVAFDVNMTQQFFNPERLQWSHREIALGTVAGPIFPVGDSGWNGKPWSFSNLVHSLDLWVSELNDEGPSYINSEGLGVYWPHLSKIDHTAFGDVKATREVHQLLMYLAGFGDRPKFVEDHLRG